MIRAMTSCILASPLSGFVRQTKPIAASSKADRPGLLRASNLSGRLTGRLQPTAAGGIMSRCG
jgi:hypothetical protein